LYQLFSIGLVIRFIKLMWGRAQDKSAYWS